MRVRGTKIKHLSSITRLLDAFDREVMSVCPRGQIGNQADWPSILAKFS